MISGHNNMPFTTKDQDNDLHLENCAQKFTGAWWYRACHVVNLNGLYLGGTTNDLGKGVVWEKWKGFYYSLKRTEMKIRPVDY